MRPAKLLAAIALMRKLKITLVVEVGRYGGLFSSEEENTVSWRIKNLPAVIIERPQEARKHIRVTWVKQQTSEVLNQ